MCKYPHAEKFEKNPKLKPDAKLIGENGNIFNLLAICKRSLKDEEIFKELFDRVQQCKSYDESLATLNHYVNVI